MIEAIATILATLALAITLYFSSLSRIKTEQNSSITLETKGEVGEIRQQMEGISAENQRLKTLLEQLEGQNKTLTAQVEGLTNTLEVLRGDNRQTIIDYTQALRDLLQARQALATVEKQYIAAAGELEQSQKEKANAVVANEALSRQLSDSTKLVEESQAAAVAARKTIEDLNLKLAYIDGQREGLEKGYSLMRFTIDQTTITQEALPNE